MKACLQKTHRTGSNHLDTYLIPFPDLLALDEISLPPFEEGLGDQKACNLKQNRDYGYSQ